MTDFEDDEDKLAALTELSGEEVDDSTDWSGADAAANINEGPAPEAIGVASAAPMAPADDFVPNDFPGLGDSPPPMVKAAAASPKSSDRLSELQSLLDDNGAGDKLRATAADDRRQSYMDRASEALAAATRREPVHYSTGAGPTATSVDSQLLGREDARRAALLRAYAQRDKPIDPSLAQYRDNLGRDAKARADLAERRLAADIEERKRKGGVDGERLKLDADRVTNDAERVRLQKERDEWARLHPKEAKSKATLTPEAKAQAAEGNRLAFREGFLEPRDVVAPTKDDRKKVQEIAANYNGTFAGMQNLRKALEQYAKDPSVANKRNVDAKAQAVATSINVSQGNGAMSQDEARLVKDSMGSDLLSTAGLQSFFQSATGNEDAAAATLLNKLDSGRSVLEDQASGRVAPYNFVYRPSGGTSKPSSSPTPANPSGGGMIRVRKKDGGQTGSIPAAKFDPAKYERLDG